MIRDLNNRMVNSLADHLAPLPGEKDFERAKEAEKKLEQNLAEALKRTEEVMQRAEKNRMPDCHLDRS